MQSTDPIKQIELFNGTEAYARRSDPFTSHEALGVVRQSDLENKVYSVIVEQYQAYGRSVSIQDVVDLMEGDYKTISPRFAPLRRKGFIEPTGEYQVAGNGKRARRRILWKPTNGITTPAIP